jgi:hypothetical protein
MRSNSEIFLRAAARGAVACGALVLAACGPQGSTQSGTMEPAAAAAEPAAGAMPESRNMRLVGYNDLQGRAAYHPIPHRYGDRMIFFVGHHAGEELNPMTGKMEKNGMSVLDVTDPAHPVYLAHVPPTGDEASGTQHVQPCDGSVLPNGDPNKVYLVRTNGQVSAELLDVTDPANPKFMLTINETGKTPRGRRQTHKIQWDCETGMAYLNGTTEGWLAARTLQLYDLSDPEHPKHVRDFALDGWQPGSTGSEVSGLHQPFAYGNRVYMGYNPSGNGVIQILDRDKLIHGDPSVADPFAPTSHNLLYPQIGRLDMPSYYGAHTTKPILGMDIADYADNGEHKSIDMLIVTSEETGVECESDRDITFFVDITEEAHPFPISSFQVPEEPGDFCHRGGRFGVHAPQDAYNPSFDKKLVLLAYFNAGVRAVDIRNPFTPREVGYYIPQVTDKTKETCTEGDEPKHCATVIQTNNVNVDDRGYIYIVDRAGTGAHILELTGEAREIVGL